MWDPNRCWQARGVKALESGIRRLLVRLVRLLVTTVATGVSLIMNQTMSPYWGTKAFCHGIVGEVCSLQFDN